MRSRSPSGWRGHHGLVFDGRQSAKGILATPAVVGAFDPGDYGDPQLLPGGLGLSVEDVLLQEAEEALHGAVVAGGADATHQSDQAMTVQCLDVFPAPKRAAPVGMQDAAGDITTPGNSTVYGLARNARRHSDL